MSAREPISMAPDQLNPGSVFALVSDKVNLQGVCEPLIQFTIHMGYVHRILFGTPIVITSGKDSLHSPGSLHGIGKAVDVRVKDLSEADQLMFLAVLLWAAPGRDVAVFDERALGTESHIHMEYHGS